jgi:hypothetical protein
MDFTKLKLNEGVSSSNNLAISAADKAKSNATDVSAPAQKDVSRKEMQMKQRTAKLGTPNTSQTMMANSYDHLLNLRNKKQAIKMYESSKCDWRKEIMEAANPDEDPDHPYVEVMPHYQYRIQELIKNTKKAAMKDKAKGEKPIAGGINQDEMG